MAYNNVFPMGYQPMNYQPMNYAQPQYNNQLNQQAQNSSSLIWVQGIEGAKSYLVAPNTTVQLWDSESQVIYLKSADASGMPSMKVLDYTVRGNAENTQKSSDMSVFATKEDINTLNKKMAEIEEKMKEIRGREHEFDL